MRRDRVSKHIKHRLERRHGGFELVGDAGEAHLLAALEKQPSQLIWRRRYNRDAPHDTRKCSPFGWLEVRSAGAGGFNVFRNDEPLCHATCRTQPGGQGSRSPSLFVARAAAQAAAELHMAQGWGHAQREPDALAFAWQTQSHWAKRPQRAVSASEVVDAHRFGLEELRRICHPWGYPLGLVGIAKELSHPNLPQEVWGADFAPPACRISSL